MRGVRARIGMLTVVAVALMAGAAWAEVVGRTTLPLEAQRARVSESTLGDLVADAARSAMEAEVALVQASQVRATALPAGDLTREALQGALLYPDERVVLVEMSGEMLLAALERSVSVLPQPSTGFLQVSGMTVRFRSEGTAGQRVESVRVGSASLRNATTYRVAMPDSLAKGALGYFRIFNGLQPVRTGPALGEAVGAYVLATGTISIPPGERLEDLSAPSQ
jgi:2',3'-cyclic-nucleotide 2'-phosphodiesterase (5'-nucleotidase family)